MALIEIGCVELGVGYYVRSDCVEQLLDSFSAHNHSFGPSSLVLVFFTFVFQCR